MRECSLVSPADVLKTAIRTKGCDSPRIVLYTEDEAGWLNGDVDVIKRQILARVPGIRDCTHEPKHSIFYMEICLPEGVSLREVVRFKHLIRRVILDQPARTVYKPSAPQGNRYVNDRVRLATAT